MQKKVLASKSLRVIDLSKAKNALTSCGLLHFRFHLIIFIDGEFWHGFEWKKKKPKIKSNRDYWIPKIEQTIKRDKVNVKKLNELGFVVFRFWEQQIKRDLEACVRKVLEFCENANG